jgi:cysteine-rich repeat protein
MKLAKYILILILVFSVSSIAQAEVDSRIMFVTNFETSGEFHAGLSGANSVCQTEAQDAELAGKFIAFISSGYTQNIEDILTAQGGSKFYNVDSELVASDIDMLFDGLLSNPIKYLADGTEPFTVLVWTGTMAYGQSVRGASDVEDCYGWEYNDDDTYGVVGRSDHIGTGWLAFATQSSNGEIAQCNEFRRLYCVQSLECGDGILQSSLGETCDDGSFFDVQCGDIINGVKLEGEYLCGEGGILDGVYNTHIPCVAEYGQACEYCDAECKLQTISASTYCGDGIVTNLEACDNGTANTNTACVAGYGETCNYCSDTCDFKEVVGSHCGDGTTNAGEGCDDGNTITETTCDARYGVGIGADGVIIKNTCTYCNSDCTAPLIIDGPRCGDNIVDAGEEDCDGTSDCEADCTPKPGQCARVPGVVPDMSCVVSNILMNMSFCKSVNGCMWQLYGCNDGIVQTDLGEECDGNDFNGESCGDFIGKVGGDLACSSIDCTIITTNCIAEGCGNNVVDGVEECDNGGSCDDGEACVVGGDPCVDSSECIPKSEDGCSASCFDEYCGDEVVQPLLDESCDEGILNTNTLCVAEYGQVCNYCNTSCKTQSIQGPYCGDGTKDAIEACDNGTANTNTVCVAGYGETCNYCSDTCDSTTAIGPKCGDGTMDVGYETCDDGNEVSGDGCSSICILELCGDGILQSRLGEVCDDGNTADDDGCSSTCKLEAKLTITHKLTDYFGTEVASITNLGNILFNINVSNTVASSAKVYLFNGKNPSSPGITTQYIYSAIPLVSDNNCTTDTTSSADFYADPGCWSDTMRELGCPCTIIDENFNEGAPLMSVYPTAFEPIDLLPQQGDFVKQIDLGQYIFSECTVDGDISTCPIYAYYINGDDVVSYSENIIMNRDNNGIPRINYSINELDNPAGVGITPKTEVRFDARNTLYRSLTSSPSSLEYFKDAGSNAFLKYDWHVGVKHTQWGAIVQKDAIPTPQYVCQSTDASQSCLGVDRTCESGDCSVIGVPCSCFDEEIYEGYTTNAQNFIYTFEDSTVCGVSGVCTVSLEVTDPNTELVSLAKFSVKLSDSDYVIEDATELYGNNSEVCTVNSGEAINTQYCCSNGYHVRDNYNALSMTVSAEDEPLCVENANVLPSVDISKPEDGSDHVVGTNVYFSADGSDSDGDSVTYLWDFGDRSEPWGKVMLDKDDDIICKQNSGSSKCDYDAAYSLEEYDEDVDVPCVCLSKAKYSEDLLNVYPDSASTKAQVTHKYDDIYACTPFDEDQTKDCEVTLWVFDEDDAFRKTAIDIELASTSSGGSGGSSGGSGGSGLYCGDGSVTGEEECDIGEVDACKSGICKSDCSCQPSVGADIKVKPLEDNVDEAVCGNNVCEFGENSATCLTDCHCGDDVCQKSLESTKTCPTDCKSSSSWIVILVIILASVGIIFYLWKEGFDFSKITSLIPKGLPSVGKRSINKNSGLDTGIAPTNPTSKLETYIRQTRDKGFSYTEIKQELMKKGWTEDKINKVFQKTALP